MRPARRESGFTVPPFASAERSNAPGATYTFLSRGVEHGVAEQPIRFALVTAAVGFEPRDDVGIQAHRDGFFRRPMELSDFGAAPIDDGGRIGKINLIVAFCGDGADVVLLLLCELPHRLSFRETRRREPK